LPGKDNIETAGRLDARLVLNGDHIMECGIRQALPLPLGNRGIGKFRGPMLHLDKDKHPVQINHKIKFAILCAKSLGQDGSAPRLIMSGGSLFGSNATSPVRLPPLPPA